MGFHDQSFLTSVSCGQSCVWRPYCGTCMRGWDSHQTAQLWPNVPGPPLLGTAVLGVWGEQPRPGLGTKLCVTSAWTSFALPWQPSPLPNSPASWPLTLLFQALGFLSCPWALPSLGLAAAPLSAPKIPCVSQTHLSANTSCSQKSSGEGDAGSPTRSAFCTQSWLRYLKNLMVFEHWLYYLFNFIF